MSFLKHLASIRGHTIWTANLGPQSSVVDAGAHRGEFSRALQERFGCRCCLVEANPQLAEGLQAQGFPNVVSAALGPVDGTARFIFRVNPESGSILPRAMDDGPATVEIETISLSTLLRRPEVGRIDLLKLDIEGAEFALIEQTPDAVLKSIGQITAEFHDFLPDFQGHGLYERTECRLTKLGFVCCPMAFRTHGDVLFLNRSTLNLSALTVFCLALFGRWVLKLRRKAKGA